MSKKLITKPVYDVYTTVQDCNKNDRKWYEESRKYEARYTGRYLEAEDKDLFPATMFEKECLIYLLMI